MPRISFVVAAFVLIPEAKSQAFSPADAQRVEEIAAMLPEKPAACGPSIKERGAWEAYAAEAGAVVAEADQLLKEPIPELPDELYLEFSKTGSRTGYQRVYARRSYRLVMFALAECATNQGRYLDGIRKEMEAILAEKTWVIPADDPDLKIFRGESMNVDLGAVSRGGTLAVVLSWLGDKLPVSLREKTLSELNRRIFEPYLTRIRTGKGPCGWVNGTNNWNAVCNAGVVMAALAVLPDRNTRAEIVAGAEKSVAKYLDGFTADGYCSEGVGYWNYGFGHYVLLAEALLRVSRGKIDLYGSPKVRKIASFPDDFALAPKVFPSFGDAGVYSQPSKWIEKIVAARLGLQPLKGPPENPGKVPGPGPLGNSLYFNSIVNFPLPAEPDSPVGAPRQAPDPLRGWFPEAGILISRAAKDGFAAAFKGGATSDGYSHHDHHDLGQFVVSYRNRTPLTDPGTEPYTGRTFSAQRFESEMLNSMGHAVPRVASQLQHGGARARVVAADLTPDQDTFVLDLKDAYDVPTLKKLERTFVFNRQGGGSLEVTDRVEFSQPESFGGALITYGTIREESSQALIFSEGPSALRVEITAESGALKISQDRVQVRLRRRPTRVSVDLEQPVQKATITYRITPSEVDPPVSFAEAAPRFPNGMTPETSRAKRLEAENFSAERRGTAAVAGRSGSSGGAVLEKWTDRMHTLIWTEDVPEEGNYGIRLRYRPYEPLDVRLRFGANDQEPSEVLLPSVSTPEVNLKEWREVWLCQDGTVIPIRLRTGQNQLKLVNYSGGDVVLDWMELVPLAPKE